MKNTELAKMLTAVDPFEDQAVAQVIGGIRHILAAEIQKQFVPFAFRCDCLGTHNDCSDVMEDSVYASQKIMVDRITKYLREGE